ncbi:very short patch repair endonuclease [Aeromonas caviae]|mgnify:CR=1 FL=1|nr:very short patch repair endonuclease [Aeromonas caviae]
MIDTLTPSERSKRMSRIRDKNTKPELALRKSLHKLGLRYRLHGSDLPGKPDLVFPRYRTVVFVHGCFWHRHAGCSIATTPKSNTSFWLDKFKKNVARDAQVIAELQAMGWTVLIVWECELKPANRLKKTTDYLDKIIRMRGNQSGEN